jgi:hypothetical protein
VVELAVAAFGPNEIPPVGFNELDGVSNLHGRWVD